MLEKLRRAFSPDPTDCPWVSEDGYKQKHLRYFGHRFHFDAFLLFSTFHSNTMWMSFRYDPLSRVFSNFQIDVFSMKTLGTVVWTDEIEMYAFSNEDLLVDGALELQPMIL